VTRGFAIDSLTRPGPLRHPRPVVRRSFMEVTTMLFIVRWTALPEVEHAARDRFLKTGGAPPEGVRMLGRWHGLGSIDGIAVCECSELEPLAMWVREWGDLLSFSVMPAMTDEQLGKVLAAGVATVP
jgi:hypothetical protein